MATMGSSIEDHSFDIPGNLRMTMTANNRNGLTESIRAVIGYRIYTIRII
jgi:hypothetical protein